jgi:hypothetical protein
LLSMIFLIKVRVIGKFGLNREYFSLFFIRTST